jgi:hypothetical protein
MQSRIILVAVAGVVRCEVDFDVQVIVVIVDPSVSKSRWMPRAGAAILPEKWLFRGGRICPCLSEVVGIIFGILVDGLKKVSRGEFKWGSSQ